MYDKNVLTSRQHLLKAVAYLGFCHGGDMILSSNANFKARYLRPIGVGGGGWWIDLLDTQPRKYVH